VPSPGRCHPCCLTRTDRRHSILGPSRGSVDTAPAAALSPRRTRLLPEAATGSSHPRRRRVEALSQARIAREYLALSWITCGHELSYLGLCLYSFKTSTRPAGDQDQSREAVPGRIKQSIRSSGPSLVSMVPILWLMVVSLGSRCVSSHDMAFSWSPCVHAAATRVARRSQ